MLKRLNFRSRSRLGLALLSIVLVLGAGLPIQAQPPDGKPFGTLAADSNGGQGLVPFGPAFWIAITGGNERDAAVAICASGQYLAVFVMDDGYVYGQRLDRQGNQVGSRFTIYDQAGGTWPHPAYEPDVACNWNENRFVVVWTVDYYSQGKYKVMGQSVYGGHQGSGSQLEGGPAYVGWTGDTDRQHPSVACNDAEDTCLVVYDYGEGTSTDIYGQRLRILGTGLSASGDPFSIPGGVYDHHNPDVAWCGEEDVYAVAWESWYDAVAPTADYYRTKFGLVWDTDQGSDPEVKMSGAFLVPPEQYPSNQMAPVVAYNRIPQGVDTFALIVFNYDFGGEGNDWDIIAGRVDLAFEARFQDAFPVSQTFDQERSPAVAFNGGTSPGGVAFNRYLVTYLMESGGEFILYGRSVKGHHAPGGTWAQLEGPPQELDRSPNVSGWYISNPDVTGSSHDGRAMAVWQFTYNTPDHDVLGRLLWSPAAFLPLIRR